MIPGPFNPGFDHIVCHILCIGDRQQTLFQIHFPGNAFYVTHRFFHSVFTVLTVHSLYTEGLLIFYMSQLFSPGFIVASAAASALSFEVPNRRTQTNDCDHYNDGNDNVILHYDTPSLLDNRRDANDPCASPLRMYPLMRLSGMRMTAAAAVSAALFCVRAADACFTTLFRTVEIADNTADDGDKYNDENEIHHSAFTSPDD